MKGAFLAAAAICGIETSALAQDTPPSDAQMPAAPGDPAFDPPRKPVVDPPRVVDSRPPLGIFPSPQDGFIDPRMARSWGTAPTRWFVATTLDLGFVYGRPRVSFGYGKPFTSWVGIDLNPLFSGNGLGAYAGVRAEVPFFDVRVGSRYSFPFNASYLEPRRRYERLDISREGTKSTTLTHEAEIDGSIPAGPGNVLLRGSVSYVTGVPDGMLVYEQALRVIMEPPLVWRARGGYAIRLGHYSQHSVGFVADILNVPKRDDSTSLRMGPVLRIVLSRRVDVRGSFVMTVVSPDKIGLRGGDFTELGVRYRWATEP